MGVLDGVTTNPSLMAKENICGEEACRRHYLEICSIVDGDVSAEVIATDFDGMVREGEALAALHKNIVVKLPCTADGIRAVKYFAGKNIRTNCTLVFSVGQALLAAKAGATYVSPFRKAVWTRFCENGWLSSPRSCVCIVTTVMIRRCWRLRFGIRSTSSSGVEAGADVATCPLAAIKGLLKHPLTDIGLAQFLADHAKVNS